MSSTKAQIWYRAIRKYNRLRNRLAAGELSLTRKLELLRKRILRMNRAWKLGLSTASLVLWLGGAVQAQFPSVFELSDLDGTNGFTVNGGISSGVGSEIAGIGDVNADGIGDFVVGAANETAPGKLGVGKAYVIFGSSSFPTNIDIASSTTLDGTNGFTIPGSDSNDFLGSAVSGLGDINGDHIDDFIIGASGAGTDGECYVVFGSSSGFASVLEPSALDGSNGFTILGRSAAFSIFGGSLSEIGDVNGDGLDDIYMSNTVGTSNAGEGYVIFGSSSGFGSVFDLANLNGTNGFLINGSDPFSRASSLAGVGDVNGDGIADLNFNAPSQENSSGTYQAGVSFTIFGSSSGFPATVDVSSGGSGFTFSGAAARQKILESGIGAGDINGDGIDDLLYLETSLSYGYTTRSAYVVFGSQGLSGSLRTSNFGANGFRVSRPASAGDWGFEVDNSSDINNDGFDDIILGLPGDTPDSRTDVGRTYVIFGKSSSFSSPVQLFGLSSSEGFVLNGIDAEDCAGFIARGVGDVNGDSIDDFTITSREATRSGQKAGECYIIFGQAAAPQPEISLTVSPATADEDSGQAFSFTFTTSLTSSSSLTVNFSVSGSASSSTDYTLSGADTFDGTNGTVTILAGQTSATITVTPIGDAMVEPDEVVTITIENP
ncbi:MAG: integrin alpha [Bacteroidota bacterium]